MFVPISGNSELYLPVSVANACVQSVVPNVLYLSVSLAFLTFKAVGKAFFQTPKNFAFRFLEWNLTAGNDYTSSQIRAIS
jgi:hypothetical protein